MSEDSAVSSSNRYTASFSRSQKEVNGPLLPPYSNGRKRRLRGRPERPRGYPKGIKRGQHKPMEPSGEFKAIQSRATMAFIDADYELAERLTLQAILLNPEVYATHSLLSEIHMAKGDHDKALTALFNGAHTRPRHIQGWLELAQLLLARTRDHKNAAIADALYCYSRVIQVDSKNSEARYHRAALNRELGYLKRAVMEYEYLLKLSPHDTTVLRLVAELYMELDQADRALEHYERSVEYYQSREPLQVKSFTWSDAYVYSELFGYQHRYDEGIFALKSISRWILGRKSESFWDEVEEDDREWDLEDHPRRIQTKEFQSKKHPTTAHGISLPLELRVKLGVYRLKSANRKAEEAMVS